MEWTEQDAESNVYRLESTRQRVTCTRGDLGLGCKRVFSCLVTAVRFQWPRWPVFAREFFDVAEMMDRLPHTSPCCLGLADRTADRKGPDLTHLGKMRVALVPIHDSSSSSRAVTYYVSAIFVGTRLTIGALIS